MLRIQYFHQSVIDYLENTCKLIKQSTPNAYLILYSKGVRLQSIDHYSVAVNDITCTNLDEVRQALS